MSTSPADKTKRTTASMATTFAGVMLLTLSIFQIIEAITALAKDDLFVNTLNYTFEIDVSSWGWIHLILGVLGGVIAIASLSAINGFLFMPYYPVWALVIIAFDVFVIWALCFQLTDPDEY